MRINHKLQPGIFPLQLRLDRAYLHREVFRFSSACEFRLRGELTLFHFRATIAIFPEFDTFFGSKPAFAIYSRPSISASLSCLREKRSITLNLSGAYLP